MLLGSPVGGCYHDTSERMDANCATSAGAPRYHAKEFNMRKAVLVGSILAIVGVLLWVLGVRLPVIVVHSFGA